MIVERRRTVGHVILPVFYDVDPSNVRKQSGTLAEAFERHEAKFRAEIDERKRKQGMERMGLWRKALGEVADLGGKLFVGNHKRNLESPDEDAFNVLRDKTEQQQLKALEDMPAKSASGTQSQNEDFLAKHTIFNEGNSLKGRCQSLFSFLRVIPAFTESFSESDEDDLKTDAFSQMI